MASRYLITGVQLGMLIAMKEEKDREALVYQIEDKQFIGNSSENVEKDAEKLMDALYS